MCSPNPTAQLTVQFFPLHEPPPHPIPLPLGGGEGARRAGEGVVHGPNACEKRKGLPMNLLPVAASRQSAADCCSHELRRSAETPLRQGSWPQRALAKSWEP